MTSSLFRQTWEFGYPFLLAYGFIDPSSKMLHLPELFQEVSGESSNQATPQKGKTKIQTAIVDWGAM